MSLPEPDSTKKSSTDYLYDNLWSGWEKMMRSPVQLAEMADPDYYTRHKFYLVFSKTDWDSYSSKIKIGYLAKYLWAHAYIDGIVMTEANGYVIFDVQLDKVDKKI